MQHVTLIRVNTPIFLKLSIFGLQARDNSRAKIKPCVRLIDRTMSIKESLIVNSHTVYDIEILDKFSIICNHKIIMLFNRFYII